MKALLIDLDDTLYRCEQVPHLVRQAIQAYISNHLGVPKDQVEAFTLNLYMQYGTTLAGLVANGHSIDYDEWHKAVHYGLLDYDSLLKPDINLRELLCSMAVPKYVLTNADRVHAQKCLARLGISDCFQGIFDFEWAMAHGETRGLLTKEHPVLCKPTHSVYQLALEEMGFQAHEVLFFDDSRRNIQAAHEVGLMTCLVGTDQLAAGADLAIVNMHHLPDTMPELLDQPGLVHDRHERHVEHAGEAMEAVAPLVAVASGGGGIGIMN